MRWPDWMFSEKGGRWLDIAAWSLFVLLCVIVVVAA